MSKKREKKIEKALTRGRIFGKIIKLSGRHARTKTTSYTRHWLAWKWTEKTPQNVEKKFLTNTLIRDII